MGAQALEPSSAVSLRQNGHRTPADVLTRPARVGPSQLTRSGASRPGQHAPTGSDAQARWYRGAGRATYPGSVVLDASEDVDADFLVVPREQPSDLLGKAAGYVLQYAEQPVLSV